METSARHRRSLRVLSPGFLTTIQDLGRYHYAHLGLSPSGAADAVSLRLGNLLVGNQPSAPAFEMTLVGVTVVFDASCFIALTGSDFGATLDGHPVPCWQTLFVQPQQILRCGPSSSGARAYLCVGGGITVETVLSGSSTHLQVSIGGSRGGPVRSGDTFELGDAISSNHALSVRPEILEKLVRPRPLRVTDGPQAHLFAATERSLFFSSVYEVKEDSNRMGLRLSGPALTHVVREEMTTEGVSLGAIQIPPNGEPIILFVEHPTTGGYPKIANIILADIHRVGQLKPRDDVRFEFVTLDAAFTMLSEQEILLKPENCLQLT
jgi:biotin-dependent carboxylase-like uncharacterized protein